jgi:hypothetical protein
MLVLVVSAAEVAFMANRENYDDPEVADAYYIALTSPNVIDELTTISPAIILIDAGDIDSARLSIPNILNTTPNLKVYRFDLYSDRISIFTSESLNVNRANKLVEFMQATSIDHQSV